MRRGRLLVGTRRDRAGVWAVLAVALAVAGLVATVWRPLAPTLAATDGTLARFPADVLEAVQAYRTPRYVVAGLATALGVLVPALFVLTRRGRRRVAIWSGPAGDGPLAAGLVALRVSVFTSLALLPLAVYVGIVHDGRWGFRTRSVGGWFLDWSMRAAGRWLLVAIVAMLFMAAVRRWPTSWPYRLTVVGTVVAAVFVLLHPLVIQPLFLPTSPMAAGPQRDAVEEVLARAGDPDVDLRVGAASLRTTRVNAVVTGLGPTQRMVVYDNLLDLPSAQIAGVVAHELAHQEHDDLLRGVALSATALLGAGLGLRWLLHRRGLQQRMGARTPGDARMIAVVLLAVASLELVGAPFANQVSRRAEAAADARAVELTRDPATLVATTRIFAVRDLSAPTAPAWARLLYGSHPSVTERVRYLEAWAQREGVELPSLADLAEEEAARQHPAIGGELPGAIGGTRP